MDTGSPLWTTCGGTTSTGPTLPADIEQAVLLKAVEFVRGGVGNVQSEAVGDLSVSYFGASNYRSEAMELLAPYRRLA